MKRGVLTILIVIMLIIGTHISFTAATKVPVEIEVYDEAGNKTSFVIYIDVDTIPPIMSYTIDKIPNETTGLWDSYITFTATDSESGIDYAEYSFDNIIYYSIFSTGETLPPTIEFIFGRGAPQSPFGEQMILLPEGTYTVYYRAGDVAGNTTEGMWLITIDKNAPLFEVFIIESEVQNGWYKSGILVVSIPPDSVILPNTVKVSFDGIEQDYLEPISLPEGAYSIVLTGRDNQDNLYTYPYMSKIRVDKTPPTLDAIFVGPLGRDNWYTGSVTVYPYAEDTLSGVNVSSYKYRIGSQSQWNSISDPIIEEGILTVELYTEDLAGHSVSIYKTIKIDKTPPICRVRSITGEISSTGWYITPVTIVLEAFDNLSGMDTVRLDGWKDFNLVEDNEPGVYEITVSEGSYESIVLTDVAGNSKSLPVQIRVDTTPPNGALILNQSVRISSGFLEIHIQNGFDLNSALKSYTLIVSRDINFSEIVMVMSDLPIPYGSSTYLTTIQAPSEFGTYYVKVITYNQAGLAAESQILKIEVAPDGISLGEILGVPTESKLIDTYIGGMHYRGLYFRTSTFVFDFNNIKGAQYVKFALSIPELQEAQEQPFSNIMFFRSNLSNGAATIYAEFLDSQHNSLGIIPISVVLDSIKPAIYFGSTITRITNQNWVILNVYIDDDFGVNQIGISINDSEMVWENYDPEMPQVAVNLPKEGVNTIKLIAKDLAGNLSDPAEIVIVKDTLPPKISAEIPRSVFGKTAGLLNIVVQTDEEDNIMICLGDEFIGYANYYTPLTIPYQLKLGGNYIVLKGVDPAGNQTIQEYWVDWSESPPTTERDIIIVLTVIGSIIASIVLIYKVKKKRPIKKKPLDLS